IDRWSVPRATVHNLTVANTHTYYVLAGATPILVHNTGGCGLPDLAVNSTQFGKKWGTTLSIMVWTWLTLRIASGICVGCTRFTPDRTRLGSDQSRRVVLITSCTGKATICSSRLFEVERGSQLELARV
ncbi:hypothetical protein, partial [Verrucosispora sp. ts21]|uniref:hypothetical protein n=1 Tax=Verrucosispora sp. ts21 TaxID=2069341 RepID=UPI0013048AEE